MLNKYLLLGTGLAEFFFPLYIVQKCLKVIRVFMSFLILSSWAGQKHLQVLSNDHLKYKKKKTKLQVGQVTVWGNCAVTLV